MLVATFGPGTAWAGKKITHEDGRFVLEGYGPIPAAQVLEYDRVSPLTWSTEGTRAWVRSRAAAEGAAVGSAAGSEATTTRTAAAQPPAAVPPAPGPAVTAAAEASAAHPSTVPGDACHFDGAHFLGGPPELGPAADGRLWVTTQYVGLETPGGGLVAAVRLDDVAKVVLQGGQMPGGRLSFSLSVGSRRLGSKNTPDRTFLMVHRTSGGCATYGVDDAGPEEVRWALAPLLARRGVPLEDAPPPTPVTPKKPSARAAAAALTAAEESLTGDVERLAALHASGALSDAEFRGLLGPVFARARGPVDEVATGVDGPEVAAEAAADAAPQGSVVQEVERLAALHAAGTLSDADFTAAKARLLE